MSDLGEFVRDALWHHQIDIGTSLPGRITAVDLSKQTIDVQPLIKRPIPRALRYADGAEGEDNGQVPELLPVVPSVKYVHDRNRDKTFSIHLPPKVGDDVLLIISQWDASQWFLTGEVSPAADRRYHHISHASALLGYNASPDKLTPAPPGDAIEIRFGTGRLLLKSDGTAELHASEIKLGSASSVAKVAREGDSVDVTIPANTFAVSVVAHMAVLNPAPITVSGTVTAGSSVVKADD